LPGVLREAGVSAERLLTIHGRPTTVKTRIVAHNQHVVRIDHEDASSISEEESTRIAEEILKHLPEAHVLVFSDYAKGLLAPRLLQEVIAAARQRNIPVLVDPKGRDYARYSGATMLTPNRIEAAEACGLDVCDQAGTELAGEQLLSRFETAAVLITQGEDGMTLFRPGHQALHLEAFARDVYDVTGAGDTVISTLSLALGAGADLASAAKLANMAAGLAVSQVGTTVITFELLRRTVEESLSGSTLKQNVEDQRVLDASNKSPEVFHA
jgi:D-beta-D-heptose 7-phosphate kinase/D-beta-D-heptose 1-phosphate adenosyltransferase